MELLVTCCVLCVDILVQTYEITKESKDKLLLKTLFKNRICISVCMVIFQKFV